MDTPPGQGNGQVGEDHNVVRGPDVGNNVSSEQALRVIKEPSADSSPTTPVVQAAQHIHRKDDASIGQPDLGVSTTPNDAPSTDLPELLDIDGNSFQEPIPVESPGVFTVVPENPGPTMLANARLINPVCRVDLHRIGKIGQNWPKS